MVYILARQLICRRRNVVSSAFRCKRGTGTLLNTVWLDDMLNRLLRVVNANVLHLSELMDEVFHLGLGSPVWAIVEAYNLFSWHFLILPTLGAIGDLVRFCQLSFVNQ